MKFYMPVKLSFSPLVQEHKCNGSVELSLGNMKTTFGRRKPSANIQRGLKNIVAFPLTKLIYL